MTKLIEGGTQTTVVYEKIRRDILTAVLEPGQRLRIKDIADAEGVSLGAVREALAKLASEEMAVATAQKGYTVPPVSAEDLRSLTETRVILEGEALAASIEGLDLETETDLVGALYRLERLPERSPADGARINPDWVAAHETFHSALVAGCKNEWLLRVRKMLYQHSERYRGLSVPLAQSQRDVNAEHRAIFDAVMAKSPKRAKKLMSEHIWHTSTILLEAGLYNK